jgi:hypothetical protein
MALHEHRSQAVRSIALIHIGVPWADRGLLEGITSSDPLARLVATGAYDWQFGYERLSLEDQSRVRTALRTLALTGNHAVSTRALDQIWEIVPPMLSWQDVRALLDSASDASYVQRFTFAAERYPAELRALIRDEGARPASPLVRGMQASWMFDQTSSFGELNAFVAAMRDCDDHTYLRNQPPFGVSPMRLTEWAERLTWVHPSGCSRSVAGALPRHRSRRRRRRRST